MATLALLWESSSSMIFCFRSVKNLPPVENEGVGGIIIGVKSFGFSVKVLYFCILPLLDFNLNGKPMTYLLLSMGALSLVGMLWLHLESRRENEKTAKMRSVWGAVLAPVFFGLLAWLPLPPMIPILVGLTTLMVVLLLVVPTGRPGGFENCFPAERFDERTVMFSRAALKPDTDYFDRYYRDHPQHRECDDKFRRLPGLGSPDAGKYEPLSFAAAAASFEAVEGLSGLIEGEPAATTLEVSPEVATAFIKGWLKKLGAVSSGITVLKDEHMYTVKGRGENWGQSIERTHRFAIAFSVEMDHRQMGTAPQGPTMMESAEQYMQAGAIATQVAVFIRNLGWGSEAHIDANYKVICPLVARDAGLGEIGRMGLLMTAELGPRVRLGVITTDLPVNTDKAGFDPAVLHFCSICKKCAEICPPGAIPKGGREGPEGNKRWRLDSESCYTYWCATGTDCGQCVRVCPYSHPNTLMHNLVRRGIKNSAIFRHFALKMDDLLYGRKPKPMVPASWLPNRH